MTTNQPRCWIPSGLADTLGLGQRSQRLRSRGAAGWVKECGLPCLPREWLPAACPEAPEQVKQTPEKEGKQPDAGSSASLLKSGTEGLLS